jgi:hypothetical protein
MILDMQKRKAGRKPLGSKPKIARTITMDSDLPAAVEKVTPNLSGFLNEAGWEKLRRHRHNSATRPKTGNGK